MNWMVSYNFIPSYKKSVIVLLALHYMCMARAHTAPLLRTTNTASCKSCNPDIRTLSGNRWVIRTALPKQYATLLSSTNVSRVPG